MKDKIHIVSWLLTRRCNLSCDYCGIASKIKGYGEEMTSSFIREGLERFKAHNPNAFHIFYGGEPFLRDDLFEIIIHSDDLNYTIITNATDEVHPKIMDMISAFKVKGLTVSIDPDPQGDAKVKSDSALRHLQEYKEFVDDLMVEITVDNKSITKLPSLVRDLTDIGVMSDITFVDVAKSHLYDFAGTTDDTILVRQTKETAKVLQTLMKPEYNVHMQKTLLPEIFNILPSKLDCELEKGIHNLTIDSDGSVRLCLRIRGALTQLQGSMMNYISPSGNLDHELLKNLIRDKEKCCFGCNWTCQLMSKLISEGGDVEELTHG